MKTKLILLFLSALLMPFLSACTHRPIDRSMGGGWDHMMGFGGIFMWLILIIVAGVVLYVVLERRKSAGNLEESAQESPSEILKRRYAKGEITKEEFDRLKKDIER